MPVIDIAQLIEEENLKAEIDALSTIRENLFKENKSAEAVVIINVQKRLKAILLKKHTEPVVDGNLIWTVVSRCGCTIEEAKSLLSDEASKSFILASLELEQKKSSPRQNTVNITVNKEADIDSIAKNIESVLSTEFI
ncbi:hypothetical protein MKY29_03010 [Psychrobacillus sp. FSL K6-2365]|uniref:hypothetical protein n=1 Tax=Psychrobacillus sp. FSL K6-2365 TaxID=2921546 RepID=UPI0030F78FF7